MEHKNLTPRTGAPVPDNQNIITAGKRGAALLQDACFLEKMAHFDRVVIPPKDGCMPRAAVLMEHLL
jgi:catalase